MPVYPLVCLFSCSERLYLRDSIILSFDLSPRWGYASDFDKTLSARSARAQG